MVGHSFVLVHMYYKQETVFDSASLKRQKAKELVSFPFLFVFWSHDALFVKNLIVGPTMISGNFGLVPW